MTLKLNGSTDGSVSLDAPSDTSPSGSDITLTLPTTTGSANQFVKNGGTAGELEYSSMVETSTGIGIGTSAPSTSLHIAAGVPAITLQDTTHNTDARIKTNDNGDLIFEADYNNERSDSRIGFEVDGSEKIRVDSDGHLQIRRVGVASMPNVDTRHTRYIVRQTNGQEAILGSVYAQGKSSWGGELVFASKGATGSPSTGLTEAMRILSTGDVTVGKTTNSLGGDGIMLGSGGLLTSTRSHGYTSIFNRGGNDGQVIVIAQGQIHEGSINVSGTTVSYNGGHLSRWSQLAGGAERTEILRGSVLSNLDEMCEWAHAAQDAVLYTEEDELPEGVSVGDVKTPAVDAYTEENEQLNRMKVSDVEGDVNVSGVFQDWDDDDDTYTNDFFCAMTGDFVIRIAQGTTVARGDLLMSAGDGTAKPQDDDIVRSKTIAKVTSTTVSTTYSDGSYCVPCVLMAC